MKSIILLLALLLPVFLSAQGVQKTQTVAVKPARTTEAHNTSHPEITIRDRGVPRPAGEREYPAREYFIVEYSMKDGAKESRSFRNLQAADAFMERLAHNPNCIKYFMYQSR